MRDKINNIIKQTLKRLKEESSTGVGGGSFSPGEGAQYTTPKAFSKTSNKPKFYYKIGYKNVPKKIKGSGLEVKQLWEEEILNEYNDFQLKRIKAFDTIEEEINSLLPMLSQAKNETAEFYSSNPGSFEVYTATDLILDYIKDIKTLLKEQ
jgi:hypothetical protein